MLYSHIKLFDLKKKIFEVISNLDESRLHAEFCYVWLSGSWQILTGLSYFVPWKNRAYPILCWAVVKLKCYPETHHDHCLNPEIRCVCSKFLSKETAVNCFNWASLAYKPLTQVNNITLNLGQWTLPRPVVCIVYRSHLSFYQSVLIGIIIVPSTPLYSWHKIQDRYIINKRLVGDNMQAA